MEYGLGLNKGSGRCYCYKVVLILVLMEYGLGRYAVKEFAYAFAS